MQDYNDNSWTSDYMKIRINDFPFANWKIKHDGNYIVERNVYAADGDVVEFYYYYRSDHTENRVTVEAGNTIIIDNLSDSDLQAYSTNHLIATAKCDTSASNWCRLETASDFTHGVYQSCMAQDDLNKVTVQCESSDGSNCYNLLLKPKPTPRSSCSFDFPSNSCSTSDTDDRCNIQESRSDSSLYCVPSDDTDYYQCSRFRISSDGTVGRCQVRQVKCGYNEDNECVLLQSKYSV